jgi:zinc transporter 9
MITFLTFFLFTCIYYTTQTGMAMQLAKNNYHFLLGKATDPETDKSIRALVTSHPAIDSVFSVQSKYIGRNTYVRCYFDFICHYYLSHTRARTHLTFYDCHCLTHRYSYKFEVDFDGTFFAAQINQLYVNEIRRLVRRGQLSEELPEILSFYAEDIIRLLEKNIHDIENQIRRRHPGAAFIDIEPDSSQYRQSALSQVGDVDVLFLFLVLFFASMRALRLSTSNAGR